MYLSLRLLLRCLAFSASYIYAWNSATSTGEYHFTSLIYSKRIFSVFTLCWQLQISESVGLRIWYIWRINSRFLIAVLPVSQGGFIDVIDGTQRLNLARVFSSPHVYSFIGFAITSSLFLSSLY